MGKATVHRISDNVRKLLPSLAMGVAITLMAALFNYVIYDRRLPAMAVGNRLFIGEDVEPSTRQRIQGPVASVSRVLAGLINLSDDLVVDAMYSIRGPGTFPSTRDSIAVIAIDEASIMRRSWPWSRRDIATLVEKTADAKVVGVDLVFSDPDRTSLANFVPSFEKLYGSELDMAAIDPALLDNDLNLGHAISQTRSVLGFVLYNGSELSRKSEPAFLNYRLDVVDAKGDVVPTPNVLLKRADNVLTNIPALRDVDPAPLGEGFINLFPPPGGVVRTLPLFARVPEKRLEGGSRRAERIYPSLALEIMRVALGGDAYRLDLRDRLVSIPELDADYMNRQCRPVRGVGIMRSGADGNSALMEIPLNELGEMDINFRSHRGDFRVYPAWEVIEGMHDGVFKDKLVLIGGTVEGVGIAVSSGLPDPDVSIVEAHACLLSAMLKGDFMDSGYQDDYAWQQVAILASGLAVTAALIFGNLGFGVLVSGLAMIAILVSNYFLFFSRGMDVGVTLPILSTLAVMILLMITNYLVVGRERRFIRKAFSLNVSPSILGYLESHPDRLSSLQGENRRMTVLFTDIRGFTSISERMTAPDLARFLNEYFTPMSDIVMQNMGTVDKFIGDGLMAFWNAPADNPHHPRDAAKSALDMLAKLDELQSGWTNRGLPQISIGCGINTGLMFAGYMGSEQRKNYTVMGDNVNIASRIENLNKFYSSSILITESTRDELKQDFICRVADKVRVSGKETAIVIYELLGMGPASDELNEELAAFARVFELYQMREFATAKSLLKELVFIRPAPLYKMYLDRLAIYKALPPPADWDGTFSMMQK